MILFVKVLVFCQPYTLFIIKMQMYGLEVKTRKQKPY